MKDYYKNIPGYLYEDEAAVLQKHAEDKTVLEVGAMCGRSTCCLAAVAKEVHTVDSFDVLCLVPDHGVLSGKTIQEMFLKNISVFHNITPVFGRSGDALPHLPDELFDVLFIDGDHRRNSVALDFLLSIPKMKKSFKVFFHDYDEYSWWDMAGEAKWDVAGVVNSIRKLTGVDLKVVKSLAWFEFI